jgi:dienelactone hydrolase
MLPIHIDDHHRFMFAEGEMEHWVYRDGAGPGVLILHELPGMTPKCIELAQRVMNRGFTVYLPLFFGDPGDESSLQGGMHVTALCIRREFECFATDKTSPVSVWLRALCRQMKSECGGVGIGAIGMCFTGSIILSLMVDNTLLVPVLSQPALPFHQGHLPGAASPAERRRALGIHPDDLAKAKQRATAAPILAYRFATDKVCPRERFERLREEFGGNVSTTEIPTGSTHPGNFPDNAHSVLTKFFVDEPGNPTRKALDEILARFDERLRL